MWWIIVCVVVVALVGLAARYDRRRRPREHLGESPDQWKVEHQATNEALNRAHRPDVQEFPWGSGP